MKQLRQPVSAIPAFCLMVLLLIGGSQVLGQETAATPGQVPASASGQTDAAPLFSLSIAKTGSGQGKVWSTPQGTSFKKGTAVTVHAAPEQNSVFEAWSGSCSGSNRTCTVTMTGDKAVTASFFLRTYTIHVRSPVNGVIHPFGSVKVAHGEKRRFQIIPLPGYRVSEVFVDKTSIGAVNSYTFTNVTGDHNLEAVFVKE